VVSSRRGLLASLGGAVLLGGCGEGGGPPAPRADESRGGDSSLADVALLNDALAAERRTVGVLPRARAHVRALERAIARAGGEARPAAEATATGGAERAAEELIAFYVDVLAKLAEPGLRVEVAALLSDAARALAEARAERGADPAPAAFVAGEGPP
jgi:hypothetical protein